MTAYQRDGLEYLYDEVLRLKEVESLDDGYIYWCIDKYWDQGGWNIPKGFLALLKEQY